MASFSSYFWLACLALTAGPLAHAEPAPSASQTATTGVQASQPLDSASYHGLTTTNAYVPLSGVPPTIRVTPISAKMRQEFHIPTYYTKGLIVRGIPIASSDKGSDYALLECAYTLDHLFKDSPPWVLDALTKAKARMAMMSSREYTMDLPENLEWQTDRSPQKMAFWDERARGMGGLPDASCAEENLLNLSSDPYRSENITIHEFSHTVASAIKESNRQWYERLVAAYKHAMATGRFAHTYSASNEQEYWAEGAQMWFDCAVVKRDSAVHNGIWNREQLKLYDPDLAKLVAEVYGNGSWRYVRTDGRPLIVNDQIYTRSTRDMAHLVGLSRSQIPAFNLANSPRVRALKARTAPSTVPEQ
ncbi:hypothetical protein IAD21_01153 [Abditibacteriota bacterium]|nr:hypothetical protein IAD21_01153 [Abditibacteriota bacterium]